MKNNFLILGLCILFFSCSNDSPTSEEIFNDVISYNKTIHNVIVSSCKVIDADASCGGKTKSCIISCEGSNKWFKWNRSYNSGEYIVTICTLPKNFENYHCNPDLSWEKEYFASEKTLSGWKPLEYF